MTKLLEKSHNPEPLVTDTSCEPSDANMVWQIIQLSFSFHNIKTFSSLASFSKFSTCPPRLQQGQKNVLNLTEERLNPLLVQHHSHMSTSVNSKWQIHKEPRSALQHQKKGYKHDVLSLPLKIFCCHNTGKTQTRAPPPQHAPACTIHTFFFFFFFFYHCWCRNLWW